MRALLLRCEFADGKLFHDGVVDGSVFAKVVFDEIEKARIVFDAVSDEHCGFFGDMGNNEGFNVFGKISWLG